MSIREQLTDERDIRDGSDISWTLPDDGCNELTSMMESRFLPSSSLFCTVLLRVLYSVSTSCLFVFRSLISCSSSSIRFS